MSSVLGDSDGERMSPMLRVSTDMIYKTLLSLVMFVALTEFTLGIAADKATVLIEGVVQEVHDSTMWEAEGQLITENADSATQSKTEIPFRVALEYPADGSTPARARLEIMGGENPLVRVCDGHFQWTYLVVPRQYWKISEPQIDACAYPYTEWVNLAVDLSSPVIVGEESLNVARRTINCTVVRADFAAQDRALAGSRTLWIDDLTKMVWQYRVERTGGPGRRSVQTYRLLWQIRGGAGRPDLFQFQPTEGTELSAPPTEPITGAEERLIKTRSELPKNLYRISGIVTAPICIYKVDPNYTKAAQKAKIEGKVILRAVVQPDGTARDFKVIQSLDPGLDQKAIEAVAQWRFRPGVRDGNPVAVLATFEVNFKLR